MALRINKLVILSALCAILSSCQVNHEAFESPSIFAGDSVHGQFSDSFLETSSSVDLLKAVINHSHFSKILAFSNPRDGFLSLRSQLNGMRVFLERDNMGEALVEVYTEFATNAQEGFNQVHLYSLAALLNMPEVFYKLTEDQLDLLKSIAITYQERGEGFAGAYLSQIGMHHRQIDEDVMSNSSTETLLDVILNSSIAYDFLYPEKPREYFIYALSFDHGLQELVRRTDSPQVVVKAFLNQTEYTHFTLRSMMLSMLVNQPEFALEEYRKDILSKLPTSEKDFFYVLYFERAAAECNSPYQ